MNFEQDAEELKAEATIADKFEDSVSNWTEELTRMKSVANLYHRLNNLHKAMMKSIKAEPGRHVAIQLTEYKTSYAGIMDQGGATISEEECLADLATEVEEALTSLERTMAEHLPPPSPVVGKGGEEDHASSRRDTRPDTTCRLPKIELPTFT